MKSICFFTFCRSDYTSLKPVIKAMSEQTEMKTLIVSGGSHILKRFGESIHDLERDQIKCDKILDFMREADDSDKDIAYAYSRALNQVLDYLTERKPNCVFILGDRWEMLAAATAASLLRIPIIHHSGGDLTQGSFDNQIRYAISILSTVHLTAHESHSERLIIQGEDCSRVHTVGEPALSEISHLISDDSSFFAKTGLSKGDQFVLATFHPTTFESLSFTEQLELFIYSLDQIKYPIVLTAPNPDSNSATFFKTLQNYAEKKEKILFFENLGKKNYYCAMNNAAFMIGNSSSGIWEGPSFALPVINLGLRQQGRLRSLNVIDSELSKDRIDQSLKEVQSVEFLESLKGITNPYGGDGTIQKIVDITLASLKSENLTKKYNDPLLSRGSYA